MLCLDVQSNCTKLKCRNVNQLGLEPIPPKKEKHIFFTQFQETLLSSATQGLSNHQNKYLPVCPIRPICPLITPLQFGLSNPHFCWLDNEVCRARDVLTDREMYSQIEQWTLHIWWFIPRFLRWVPLFCMNKVAAKRLALLVMLVYLLFSCCFVL